MKTNRVVLAFLVVLFVSLRASAQSTNWRPGQFMQESMVNTLKVSHYFEQNSQFGFIDGVCILGAYVRQGKQVSWVAEFTAGTEYVVVGAGGSDTRDLDLKVFNANNILMVSDVKTDNTPVVRFTPSQTGRYTIQLTLYSCATTWDFCGMSILKKYGNSLPSENMGQALGRLLAYGTSVNGRTSAKFHDAENQWCLYGYIVPPGESQTVSNIWLGYDNHVIIAASDNACSDIDLYLSTTSDRTVAQDTDTDANPYIKTWTSSSERYKVRVRNVSSSGKSLIMSALLTI
jgi:hypothetical protein